MQDKTKGYAFVFSESILWGLFPILTLLSIRMIPPLYTAGISTLIAGAFFFIWIIIKKKKVETSALKPILLTTLLIGILFYGFLYVGLQYTTAGNAGILLLSETFFTFLILGLLKKEKITSARIFGAILMISGTLLIVLPNYGLTGKGDFLIIFACIFPPMGNFFMKKARYITSSANIMLIRSVISGFFLLALAFLIGPTPKTGNVYGSLVFLLLNGILILGLSKVFWIEAIHRLPITTVSTLSVSSAFFTILFAFIFLGEVPNINQMLAFLPMIFGAILIIRE